MPGKLGIDIDSKKGMTSTQKNVRFSETKEVNVDSESTEVFTMSCEAYTPKIKTVEYKDPSLRPSEAVAPPSSIVRPNYDDLLRRVSVVINQHIRKCEAKLASTTAEQSEKGLFHASKIPMFSEENFISPQFVYSFVRLPITRTGLCYGLRKLHRECVVPQPNEVYTFLRNLFVKAQLSPECSIVCLIYVERLMENAKVPLVAVTWRPCLLCGLLLASKVWQDLR